MFGLEIDWTFPQSDGISGSITIWPEIGRNIGGKYINYIALINNL